MEPKKRYSPAWHEISKAWKSVAELKEELSRAEEKLDRVAKENFSHSYGTKSKHAPSTQPHSFSTRGKKQSRGRLDAFSTRPKSAFERPSRTIDHKMAVDKHVTRRHEHNETPPPLLTKMAWSEEPKPQDPKQTTLPSSPKKIPLDHLSISSSESKTNDMAVNSQHPDGLPSLDLKKDKNDAPLIVKPKEKIVFTDWEREFLQKELSVFEDSGVETDPQALKETEVFCVNDPIILPSSNHVSKQHHQFKIASSHSKGFQKMKELVERQRENQDQNLSWNSDASFPKNQNYFLNNRPLHPSKMVGFASSIEDSETDSDKPTARVNDEQNILTDIDAEIRAKPVSTHQSSSLGIRYPKLTNGQLFSNRNTILTSSDTGSDSFDDRSGIFPKDKRHTLRPVEKKDAEVMVKPIPLRIVKHAIPPSEYRGFAAHGRNRLETVSFNRAGHEIDIKVFQVVDRPQRRVLKSKRLKKIVPPAKKEDISPSCWRQGRDLILKTLGPFSIPPELKPKTKTDEEPLSGITPLSSQSDNIEESESNDRQKSPQKDKIPEPKRAQEILDDKVSESSSLDHLQADEVAVPSNNDAKPTAVRNLMKEILKDSDETPELEQPHSISSGKVAESNTKYQPHNEELDVPSEDHKPTIFGDLVKEILKDTEELIQTGSKEDLIKNPSPPKQAISKKIVPGKKRKYAKHQQIEHRISPPKVRHYDPEVVRKYMHKKRNLRKKMQETEKQNKIQAQQDKQQRLEQLYSFQKQVSKQSVTHGLKRKPLERNLLGPAGTKTLKTVIRIQEPIKKEMSFIPRDFVQTTSSGDAADESFQEEESGPSSPSSIEELVHVPSAVEIPLSKEIPEESMAIISKSGTELHELAKSCEKELDDLMASVLKTSSNVPCPETLVSDIKEEENILDISDIMLPHLEKNRALREFAESIQNQIDTEASRLQGLLRSVAQSSPATLPSTSSKDDSLQEGPLSDTSSYSDKNMTWRRTHILKSDEHISLPGGSNSDSVLVDDPQKSFSASKIQAAFRKYRDKKQLSIPPTTVLQDFQSPHDDSLSEGPLSSEDELDESHVWDAPEKPLDDHQNTVKAIQKEQVISTFSVITSSNPDIPHSGGGDWKSDIKPDPFNFITAWRKKQQDLLDEIRRQKTLESKSPSSVSSTTKGSLLNEIGLEKNGSWSYSSDFTGSADEQSDMGNSLPKEDKMQLTNMSEVSGSPPEEVNDISQKSFPKSSASSSPSIDKQKVKKSPKSKRKRTKYPSNVSSSPELTGNIISVKSHSKDSSGSVKSNDKSVESLSEGPLSSSSANSHHASIQSFELSAIKEDGKPNVISRGSLETSEEQEPTSPSKSIVASDQVSVNNSSGSLDNGSVEASSEQPLPKMSGPVLCPTSLGFRMISELAYLENLNDSLLQLSEVNRIHAVAVAEQNSIALAHVLQGNEQKMLGDEQPQVLVQSTPGTEVSPHKEKKTQPEAVPSISGTQTTSSVEVPSSQFPKKLLQSSSEHLEKTSPKNQDSCSYSSDFEPSDGSKEELVSHHTQSFPGSHGSLSEDSIPEDIPSIGENSSQENKPIPSEPEEDSNDLNSENKPLKSVETDRSLSDQQSPEQLISVKEKLILEKFSKKASKRQVLDENFVDDEMDKSYRMILPCEGHRQRHLAKKHLHRKSLSSASPESLSDQDTLSSVEFTSRSSIGASSQKSDDLQSLFSDDSFTQFTLDMVRRMTYEEELRAKHQLALLHLQEKALVDKARAEMAWLKHVKRKFHEKGAEDKLQTIRKRQHSLLMQLRQERAQLRSMQETYRRVTQKHHKEKLATFLLLNKSAKHSSSSSSTHRKSNEHPVPTGSPISSLASCPTDDGVSIAKDADFHSDIPEVLSSSDISSPQSVIETQGSHKLSTSSKYSHPSKSNKPVDVFGTYLSNHSSHSLESILKGLKRLEAGKRYLTKREQKLLQRRKDVEHLLHWQKQLDDEEKAILDMEKKALELVEADRNKRHFINSNTEGEQDAPTTTPSSSSKEQDTASSTLVTPDSRASPLQEKKEENAPYGSSSSVVEEMDCSHKPSDASESVQEELTGEEPKSSSPQSKASSVAENSEIPSAPASNVLSEEIVESHSQESVLYSKASLSGGEMYPDSFESAETSSSYQHNNSTSPFPLRESEAKSDSGKKASGVVIRSPLFPRSHRRHDSSGSDDSYTISHSETASDQSDIEGRIHALSEELRRRQVEAEKLKREQKRRYREQLKETELSLQKQIEAYNHFIQQATQELEQELEASFSRPDQVPVAVKPQIKQPRVAESRRLRRQLTSPGDIHTSVPEAPDSSLPQKRADDSSSPASSGTDGRDASLSHSSLSLSPHQDDQKSQLFPPESSIKTPPLATRQTSAEVGAEGLTSPSTSTVSTASSLQDSFEESQRKVDKESDVQNDLYKEIDVSETHEEKRQSKSPIAEESELVEDNLEAESESSNQSGDAEDIASVTSAGSGSKTLEQSLVSVESDGPSGSHSTLLEEDEEHQDSSDLTKYDKESSIVSVSSSAEGDKKRKTSEFVALAGTENKELTEPTADITTSKQNILKRFAAKPRHEKEHIVTNLVESIFNILHKESLSEIHSIVDTSPSVQPGKTCSSSQKQSFNVVLEPYLETIAKTPSKDLSVPKDRSQFAITLAEQLSSELVEDALKCMLDLRHQQISDNEHPNLCYNKTTTHSLDVSRKVTSILASLEEKKSPREKTRPQDLMILSSTFDDDDEDDLAWKDVQPSAPSLDDDTENKISFEVQAVIAKTGATSQVLGLKEDEEPEWFEDDLVVPTSQQEQQQLEQQLLLQQYQQLYYRQIPNKPPPPYTPPQANSGINSSVSKSELSKPPEPFFVVPHKEPEVQQIVAEGVTALLKEHQMGVSFWDLHPELDHLQPTGEDVAGDSNIYYKQFLFDLTIEATQDIYREKSDVPPPWLRPKKLTQKAPLPDNEEVVTKRVQKEVLSLLKITPAVQKATISNTIKLGHKKRDFIDTILIQELKEEEPEWVNYNEDEVTVKMQLSTSIFNFLIDDTVEILLSIFKKRQGNREIFNVDR